MVMKRNVAPFFMMTRASMILSPTTISRSIWGLRCSRTTSFQAVYFSSWVDILARRRLGVRSKDGRWWLERQLGRSGRIPPAALVPAAAVLGDREYQNLNEIGCRNIRKRRSRQPIPHHPAIHRHRPLGRRRPVPPLQRHLRSRNRSRRRRPHGRHRRPALAMQAGVLTEDGGSCFSGKTIGANTAVSIPVAWMLESE